MKICVAKEEVDFWIGCCERRLKQIDEYRANIDRQNEAKYAEFYNRLGWWRKKFHSPTLLPGSGWNSVIRDFYPSINGWGGYDHVKSLQRKLEILRHVNLQNVEGFYLDDKDLDYLT